MSSPRILPVGGFRRSEPLGIRAMAWVAYKTSLPSFLKSPASDMATGLSLWWKTIVLFVLLAIASVKGHSSMEPVSGLTFDALHKKFDTCASASFLHRNWHL